MKNKDDIIEIPFGAKDSELYKFEYTIPEGYEAEIKDGKVIVKKKESEDERIIGNIKKAAELYWSDEPLNEILSWLEKQKENTYGELMAYGEREHQRGFDEGVASVKPAGWSEDDDNMLQAIIKRYGFAVESDCAVFIKKERLTQMEKELAWLKSLRPQPKAELTLLDENIINAAVAFVEQNNHFNCWLGVDKHTVIKALRSLKPHWKPSEEQMEYLAKGIIILGEDGNCKTSAVLNELRNDLQKLL